MQRSYITISFNIEYFLHFVIFEIKLHFSLQTKKKSLAFVEVISGDRGEHSTKTKQENKQNQKSLYSMFDGNKSKRRKKQDNGKRGSRGRRDLQKRDLRKVQG